MWHKSLWLLRSLPFEPMALTTLDTLTQKLEQMKDKQNDVLASKVNKRILNLLPSSYMHSNNKLPESNGVITSALVEALLPLACKWFDSGKLFFISPKHDGVRLISYVPTTEEESKGMLCNATESNSISPCHDKLVQTSCYTRYGRPLYGVFWLEPELCLLRHVCGDLHLVLDGELYIHRSPGKHEKTQEESNRIRNIKSNAGIATDNANINNCNGDMAVGNTNNKRQVKSWTERGHDRESKSSEKCSDVFKTGFLAVSSLVHRLRGSSTHILRTEDMLQHVSTLPSYCVFDVASYNPPISFIEELKVEKKEKNWNNKNNISNSKCQRVNNTINNTKNKGTKHNMKVVKSNKESEKYQSHYSESSGLPSYVSEEIEKTWHYALTACKVNNVEELRVIPNVTPFSSRLRTLHFLFTLLTKAYANNILYEHFIVNQESEHQELEEEEEYEEKNSESMCIDGTKRKKCNKCSRIVREQKQHNLRQESALIWNVTSNNHHKFVNAQNNTTRQKSKKKDVTSKDRRHREMYMKRIPYHVVHSLHEAQNVFLPQFLNDGYEGAVIRSPMNVYEMKEKNKNTVAGLVFQERSASRSNLFALPVASSHESISAASTQRTRQSERNHNRKKMKLTQGKQCNNDKDKVTDNNETINRKECNTLLCEAAIQLSRWLPPRSHSVVKLLAFKDTEYAVLRPLLKLPSTNPRSRPLIEIPIKQLGKTSQSHNIKENTHDRRVLMKQKEASQAYAASTTIERNQLSVDDDINVEKQQQQKKKKKKKSNSSVNLITSEKSTDANNNVAFYGLQCVAENGRVFNVSLPKMSAEQQQLLLDHLLQTSKRKRSAANSKNKSINTVTSSSKVNNSNKNSKACTMTASAAETLPLTGLYVTVKYSTLTEHGIPRFASVKAIRGGKGWFM